MSEKANLPQDSNSLEDRIGILSDEFDLAIHWNLPSIWMVAYGSEFVRADAVSALENFLIERRQKVIWIHAGGQAVNSLGYWQKILGNSDQAVFFIDDLKNLAHQRALKAILNQHAYLFAEKRARVVFWLTYKEASVLAYQAPNIWAQRQRLIELNAQPKPEQILQSALESAWQGTGEYSDRFDDTEQKISLRESFLKELPKQTEATSIRANLLLALGILHWRKGDCEKADDVLQNALKIAALLQDNWFEAECFNAIALMKSSLGKNQEAIDAYKQAINLAPGQIFAWNNLGNLCVKINRNDEAMIAFQKAIEHNPTDPIAWNGLGDVYSRSGYIDDAIAAYRKSIEYAPLLPHPWNGLGEIYIRSGRPHDAVNAFQKAIGLNKNFIAPWLGLAVIFTKQEQYREAFKAYQQALALDPKNSVIWNDLGCVYLSTGRYDDAVDAFSKAIEFDRAHGWAYSNLGLAHASHGKQKDGIALYIKSFDLNLNETQRKLTWNRLANAYRAINEYDNAIKAYQMADSLNNASPLVAIASNNPEPAPVAEAESVPETESSQTLERSEVGPVQDQKRPAEESHEEETPFWVFQPTLQPEEFQQLFPEATLLAESNTDNPESSNATSQPEIGDLSMALPLSSTAILQNRLFNLNADPAHADLTSARVWNEMGNAQFRAGAYSEAIRAYNKAIQIDRSFGWPYCNLGATYLHVGKHAEAILLLQKSIELLKAGKDQAVAWNELGNLYRGLNDYDNALAAYQKADELDPDHVDVNDSAEYLYSESNEGSAHVLTELGELLFKSGSYHEASNCFRKTIERDPLNAQAYINLALCLMYQSKFEDAVPLYVKSIGLLHDDKDKAEAWNQLGNVYRRLNDYENAVDAYQNAVELSNDRETLVARARFSLLGNCYTD